MLRWKNTILLVFQTAVSINPSLLSGKDLKARSCLSECDADMANRIVTGAASPVQAADSLIFYSALVTKAAQQGAGRESL